MNDYREELLMPIDESLQPANPFEPLEQDDLYPGTFFRIPGVPVPGQTTWSVQS